MKKFIGSIYLNNLIGALVYFLVIHFVFSSNNLLHDIVSTIIFYIMMTAYFIVSKRFKKQSHQDSQN
ncbi:hypothetical protein FEFB_16680 [Fructobacillus sp. EFB-N1]|nr:hypothetical protein FEFB_16680 [Fructobacillus sp. EFB-N1]